MLLSKWLPCDFEQCHPLLWDGGILVDHWSTISSWFCMTVSVGGRYSSILIGICKVPHWYTLLKMFKGTGVTFHPTIISAEILGQTMIWKNAQHNCFTTVKNIMKLTLCTQRRKVMTVLWNILSSVYWLFGRVRRLNLIYWGRFHGLRSELVSWVGSCMIAVWLQVP